MERGNKKVRVSPSGSVRVISHRELWEIEHLSMLGANNKDLAAFFGVAEKTIEYWCRNYPEVAEAKKKGTTIASFRVVDALLSRATGYNFVEERVFRVGRKLVKKKVKVHIPPDSKLIMFYLSNKHREQWTQTKRVAHSGTIEHNHTKIEDLPVENLNPATKEFLFEISQKQLENGTRDN